MMVKQHWLMVVSLLIRFDYGFLYSTNSNNFDNFDNSTNSKVLIQGCGARPRLRILVLILYLITLSINIVILFYNFFIDTIKQFFFYQFF